MPEAEKMARRERPSKFRLVATRYLVALLLVFLPDVASAKSNDASVDAYIRGVMLKRHIPGLALAVVRHGRLERLSYYGKSSIEFSIPARSGDLFHVASVSKSFTAVAVMKLVEAGKLKLDDPIGAYLNQLPESWRGVRIRNLLGHTSGLPDIVKGNSPELIADTPSEAMSLLRNKPLQFATGTQYRYDQTDYMLLGLLIERLSGQTYEHFCQTQLFDPAGLVEAKFGDTQKVIPWRGPIYTPYDFDAEGKPIPGVLKVLTFKSPPMTYPNNGLNISAGDLARWLIYLMKGRFIADDSLRLITSPLRLNDGTVAEIPASPYYPWRAQAVGGMLIAPDVVHPAFGGTGGPYAAYIAYPKDGLAVVALTNTQESNPDSIVGKVAHKYLYGSFDSNPARQRN